MTFFERRDLRESAKRGFSWLGMFPVSDDFRPADTFLVPLPEKIAEVIEGSEKIEDEPIE